MASFRCSQNLGRKMYIYCPLAFRCQPTRYYSHKNDSGWWVDGTSGQLLNLAWGLVASWGIVLLELGQVWTEDGVVQLGWLLTLGCFGWDFGLGLAMRTKHFGGILIWWFSLCTYSFAFTFWALQTGQIYYILSWVFIPHVL